MSQELHGHTSKAVSAFRRNVAGFRPLGENQQQKTSYTLLPQARDMLKQPPCNVKVVLPE
jgi:hypothetical protein